jgi:succinyl-CoA synthetase beta subunit
MNILLMYMTGILRNAKKQTKNIHDHMLSQEGNEMNKRIKELAQQANFTKQDIQDMSPGFEKFAELIVKECASFVESARLVGVFEKEPEKMVDYIKEYFGVE